MKELRKTVEFLASLPRYYKRTLLSIMDIGALLLTLWATLSVRYNEIFWPQSPSQLTLIFLAPIIVVGYLHWAGSYRIVTRHAKSEPIVFVAFCVLLASAFWGLIVLAVGQHGIPRSVLLLYSVLSPVAIIGNRVLAGFILSIPDKSTYPETRYANQRNTLIYGVNEVGIELMKSLRANADRNVVGFLDGSKDLWRQRIHGLKVFSPDKVEDIVRARDISDVLVTIPDDQKPERRRALIQLQGLPVAVRVMPEIKDIATGRVNVSKMRNVSVADLLGRTSVPPNKQLLQKCVAGKSILVTGAGGSIGSELSRQIAALAPRKLVLFEVSEAAQYLIDIELRDSLEARGADAPEVTIIPALGSVVDKKVVSRLLDEHEIKTIFHAAAYKHVPIVESNPFAGVLNNTIGTSIMVEAAIEAGVERFVLISTDKAVRPTNVMGASKRMAELVLQGYDSHQTKTVFSMVRFGNVLDSSGSVVRRFRRQIEAGGPVTVTHPDIIRYFMSIPEAAQLVLQASAMARGGEVFVLDMGEPVKIQDLARVMIKAMGFDVNETNSGEGDISIVYTGLRPGEKLYEELLLGDNTTATDHPAIFKAQEPFLPLSDIQTALKRLELAIENRDRATLIAILRGNVEGYQSEAA